MELILSVKPQLTTQKTNIHAFVANFFSSICFKQNENMIKLRAKKNSNKIGRQKNRKAR